jgi:hypothetical protein
VTKPYLKIDPYDHGTLDAGDGYKVYWETSALGCKSEPRGARIRHTLKQKAFAAFEMLTFKIVQLREDSLTTNGRE